jgi:hypothetical protein
VRGIDRLRGVRSFNEDEPLKKKKIYKEQKVSVTSYN